MVVIMSRIAKFDAYFNLLDPVECPSIVVPAQSMRHLTNNVWFYQNSRTRNPRGLILSCKKVLNKKDFTEDFTVRVEGIGRWDEEKQSE